MIHFDVLTLFPEMFEAVLGGSVIGRARENGLLEMHFINIRDFSKNKHRKVDDYPYSGGGGMLMTPQPIYDAYQSIVSGLDYKPLTIYMSPQGKVFQQETARVLVRQQHIVLLCGHYEGVDQRVLDEIVDMELSIGDFVLTGGEIPAMAVIDAVARLVPGVLSTEESYTNESHYQSLLEYPQYTRPPEFLGKEIPEILISGHHAKIEEWKHEQALLNTLHKRPDLLEKAELTKKDRDFLQKHSWKEIETD
jgi:tRNA (guanine37-N1)-methyltransferase